MHTLPICSLLQTWSKKKWQGSSSATTVACARALHISTHHIPELTKKQFHTMNELVVEGDFEWCLELVCCWLVLVAASFCFVSLSLSPSVSLWRLCCVDECSKWCGRGVYVCCVVWHGEKPAVCPFKTSSCMRAPRAHVFQHVRAVPVQLGTC